MFYLTKFCRICIRSGSTLLDIHSQDYDLVQLSEKLAFCTQMVINKEDLSTLICVSCVRKLRISYMFQTMCMKSDDLLQNYLTELMSGSNSPEEKFVNSELRVTICPLPPIKVEKELDKYYTNIDNNNSHTTIDAQITLSEVRSSPNYKSTNISLKRFKRKRVSKGQRCSLLKKLLTTINSNAQDTTPTFPVSPKKKCGGLKDLLGFIKHYDFGYKINDTIPETTPLDQLETFSKTFFYTDFTEFHNTILSVINEHHLGNADDDDMFNPYDVEEDLRLWKNKQITIKQEKIDEEYEDNHIEEIIVQPSVKIKTEFLNEPEYEPEFLPAELVQACYEEEKQAEHPQMKAKEFVDFESYLGHKNGTYPNKYLNECSSSSAYPQHGSSSTPSSLELLQQLAMRTKGSKTLSPNSVKCRTRGRPFINPDLMEQFKLRSFKCDTCNRSFKSPGYLHSHCTKMGH